MKMMRRTQKGNVMADTPITLWLLFLGLTFPLMDLGAITLRYTFLLAAARDGAFVGSRETTFTNAAAAVPIKVQDTAKAFTGITVNSVKTNIVITKIATKTVIGRQTTKLAAPYNPNNLYQIEAVVAGTLQPLIDMSGTSIVPNVPGVTAPLNTTIACREYFENPDGLDD